MPTFRCPNCQARNPRIEYRDTGYEYGRCRLQIENGLVSPTDWDADGFESDSSDMEYTCVECQEEIDLAMVDFEGDERSEDHESDNGELCESPSSRASRPNRQEEGEVALQNFEFCENCHDLFTKSNLNDFRLCEACVTLN